MITPRARVSRAIHEGTDGILPLVALRYVISFEIVTPWEAEKCWFHCGQLFHQVDTIAIDAIFVGGRKERHHVEPHCGWMRNCKDEMIGGGGLHFPGP